MLINEIIDDKYGRTTAIDAAKFNELKPNLAVALKQAERGNLIYRGSPNPNPIVYSDPNKVERISRNTSNELTLLLSHILPSWQNWPKRSRSLICSESYGNASSYSNGGAYIVLPFGDPMLGIVPGSDFWDAFQVSPPDFNRYFRDFHKTFLLTFENSGLQYQPESVQELVKTFKTYDAAVKQAPDKMAKVKEDAASARFMSKTLLDILTSGDSLAGLNTFLAPEKNDFHLEQLSKYDRYLDYEIWFSAPAVLVRKDVFNKLMN